MSCIDAAIIKALVEHIGMNPDEIPTGGSGTSSGASLSLEKISDLTFTVDGNDITMDIEEDLTIGNVLRLRKKGATEYTDYVLDSIIENNATEFLYHISDIKQRESGYQIWWNLTTRKGTIRNAVSKLEWTGDEIGIYQPVISEGNDLVNYLIAIITGYSIANHNIVYSLANLQQT